MTSFDHSYFHSQLAQSLLIPLSLRLADVRDWCSRVPLTEKFSISGSVVSPDLACVTLNLHFESYGKALAWAWMHTKYNGEGSRGYDGRMLYDTALAISMADFEVWLWFPLSTHPDQLNPELANLKPTTA